MLYRSSIKYFPLGARSAINGTRSLTRWTSSRDSGTSAVPAIARKWRTPFVDPLLTLSYHHECQESDSPKCHCNHKSILKGLLCHQVPGSDVLLHTDLDSLGRFCTLAHLRWRLGWIGRRSWKAKAHSLDCCRHSLGSIHPTASTSSWTTMLLKILHHIAWGSSRFSSALGCFESSIRESTRSLVARADIDVLVEKLGEPFLDGAAIYHDKGPRVKSVEKSSGYPSCCSRCHIVEWMPLFTYLLYLAAAMITPGTEIT